MEQSTILLKMTVVLFFFLSFLICHFFMMELSI